MGKLSGELFGEFFLGESYLESYLLVRVSWTIASGQVSGKLFGKLFVVESFFVAELFGMLLGELF